jgi:predicted O-linked N-acetylglucosamine transferase (SPINDLY family)
MNVDAPLRSSSSAGPAPGRRAARAQAAWLEGRRHAAAGRWIDAARRYDAAQRLEPADALYALNLADAWLKAGNAEAALAAAAMADAAEPGHPIALALRANALLRLKRHAELAALLGRAPRAAMDHELHVLHGVALVHERRPQEAVDAFVAALALAPGAALVHYRLGLAFNDLGLKTEARECFRTALLLGLGPLEAGVRDLLAFYSREVCDWRPDADGLDTAQALDAGLAALPADAALELNPFAHVTLLEDPLRQLHAVRINARHWAAIAKPPLPPLPPPSPAGAGRLRVGYVSADIRAHATAWLVAELFERHDREAVEVFLYSHGRDDGSAVRARIAAAADHFVDAQSLSDRALAARIRADGIHLLVDLKGYTQDARPAVFAFRPAPVQVAYLGFPGSTGSPAIDYLIGDEEVSPLAHAAHFSESLALLPGCYQCNDGTRTPPPRPPRAARRAHGLPEEGLVLCGFNQPYKVSPQWFDLWCRLLARVPGAVLWLLAWNREAPAALAREAAARGIDPSRLVFAPSLPQAEHLARIGCADLFLDTFPCNAHTTASDLLWAGVPIVTCRGRTFASRVASSLLHAVGTPETVCDDAAGYEALALALATDTPRREALRARVEAARRTSALFSAATLAPRLEALYRRMWARHAAGLPPDHLPAEA